MSVHAVDKPIVVQEATARLEEAMDRGIAGEDFFAAPEIVEHDRRDREVERACNILRPGRIEKVAENVGQPVSASGKTPARLIQHRRRIILQGDPGPGKAARTSSVTTP